MKLVFIGIQGSGKGTQARLLEDKYGFKLFESGTALRNIAAENSDLGKKVKSIIDAGDHVSPEIVENIMIDILENKSNGKNIIFDGFVRNIGNKQSADKVLKDYKVVLFKLSEEKARERLLGRIYNPKTGETFKSGTFTDPETGDKLEKRADDNEEAIIKRIKLYVDKALPLIEEYKEKGNLIIINADQSVEHVFNELVTKLNLK
ncbi:nucleoside monophosphate kinase [Candidatus Gracilibacteria bacterium]|nr:nucleoside monophosphate kinase [Candidatus Gracilibacteria bacterium]